MVVTALGASRVVLVVVLLAAVSVTAACGAADPVGADPPAATSSPCGSSGAADDLTRSLLDLPEAEATARAEAEGLPVRVVGRGADCFAVTMDFRPERVNLDLDEAGVVRAAGRG
ncbi:hypothetical protein [Quadrisphaera sp. KR29]|uniref:hypothetical protein n=1 Tax=Quadrisphaera sp. KR29 TaxID=3461391 RepID=UPI004044AE32